MIVTVLGNYREPFEPNAVYHVFNHGNAKALIFREDTNYGFFLKRFQNYIPPTNLKLEN